MSWWHFSGVSVASCRCLVMFGLSVVFWQCFDGVLAVWKEWYYHVF